MQEQTIRPRQSNSHTHVKKRVSNSHLHAHGRHKQKRKSQLHGNSRQSHQRGIEEETKQNTRINLSNHS